VDEKVWNSEKAIWTKYLMTKLKSTSETSIALIFLMMNLDRIIHFFVSFLHSIYGVSVKAVSQTLLLIKVEKLLIILKKAVEIYIL